MVRISAVALLAASALAAPSVLYSRGEGSNGAASPEEAQIESAWKAFYGALDKEQQKILDSEEEEFQKALQPCEEKAEATYQQRIKGASKDDSKTDKAEAEFQKAVGDCVAPAEEKYQKNTGKVYDNLTPEQAEKLKSLESAEKRIEQAEKDTGDGAGGKGKQRERRAAAEGHKQYARAAPHIASAGN
ncbi:hypothetical protein O9K51_00621 [Purpureocillium lavendulum]|uniref:Uncharacterized protein n=1 Tax=Purpureocillium lavendulum TaxID=1247861 RepID=A0AB34G5M7_9HYPO|nr:hypothetical protein O9K51_00621 [Purpureocillium lavendulum]